MAKSTSLLVVAALIAGGLGAHASDAALIEAAKKESDGYGLACGYSQYFEGSGDGICAS